jgi:hypothetical protein
MIVINAKFFTFFIIFFAKKAKIKKKLLKTNALQKIEKNISITK